MTDPEDCWQDLRDTLSARHSAEQGRDSGDTRQKRRAYLQRAELTLQVLARCTSGCCHGTLRLKVGEVEKRKHMISVSACSYLAERKVGQYHLTATNVLASLKSHFSLSEIERIMVVIGPYLEESIGNGDCLNFGLKMFYSRHYLSRKTNGGTNNTPK